MTKHLKDTDDLSDYGILILILVFMLSSAKKVSMFDSMLISDSMKKLIFKDGCLDAFERKVLLKRLNKYFNKYKRMLNDHM